VADLKRKIYPFMWAATAESMLAGSSVYAR